MRFASSPSFVTNNKPSDSSSSRPIAKIRSLNCGNKSMTRGLPAGSKFVQRTPRGLLSTKYTLRCTLSFSPSSSIFCEYGSARNATSVMTLPSTVTRPVVTNSSHFRRASIPAAAKIFASRCGANFAGPECSCFFKRAPGDGSLSPSKSPESDKSASPTSDFFFWSFFLP